METGEGQPTPKKWFAFQVATAHRDNNYDSEERHTNYVLATDLLDALNKAKKMRGWKRDIDRVKGRIPGIRQLTDEEVLILEQIVKERIPGLAWKKVKEEGFLYGRRKDLDRHIDSILRDVLEEKHREE